MELHVDSMSSDAVDGQGTTESKNTDTKADLFQTKTWREDTCLKVEEKCLYVSSSILSLISPKLWSQLETKMGSNVPLEIELEGKKYEDVLEFLKCIYPNIMKKVTMENALVVLPLAFEFDLKSLTRSCEEVIDNSIDTSDEVLENICLYLTKAFKYNLSDLKKACLDLAANNYDTLSIKDLESLPIEVKAELICVMMEAMSEDMEAKNKVIESQRKWFVLQGVSGLAKLTDIFSDPGVKSFMNPRVGYLEYTFSIQERNAEPKLSMPITIHGINWAIDVRINETALGVFLDGKMPRACTCSQAWKCRITATMQLHNFKDTNKAMNRTILDRSFQASPSCWGFREFAKMEEVSDATKGFIKDGKARVEMYMYVAEPTFE